MKGLFFASCVLVVAGCSEEMAMMRSKAPEGMAYDALIATPGTGEVKYRSETVRGCEKVRADTMAADPTARLVHDCHLINIEDGSLVEKGRGPDATAEGIPSERKVFLLDGGTATYMSFRA